MLTSESEKGVFATVFRVEDGECDEVALLMWSLIYGSLLPRNAYSKPQNSYHLLLPPVHSQQTTDVIPYDFHHPSETGLRGCTIRLINPVCVGKPAGRSLTACLSHGKYVYRQMYPHPVRWKFCMQSMP